MPHEKKKKETTTMFDSIITATETRDSRLQTPEPTTAAPVTGVSIPKNHKEGKPKGVKYVLLSKSLASWGKIPQQQADLAKIISGAFELNVPFTDAELFAVLKENSGKFPSIAKSVQDPTYLFRYYRGLKTTATHGGFLGRGFLREVA